MTNNFLPFLEVKTKHSNPLRFLIDTGANKNYINPIVVPSNAINDGTLHKIKNISGTHNVNQYTSFNPFIQHAKELSSQKFYLFKFHNFFDGLIGYETLRSLNAIIDTASNSLKIGCVTIPLHKKHPDQISINANETKPISVATKTRNGNFLIDEDIYITPEIKILAGLYNCNNEKITILIHNETADKCFLNICDSMDFEINNFEIKTPPDLIPGNTQKLCENIRCNNLNEEEKTKLLNLLCKYSDVFHIDEHVPLTATNAVKHKIRTKDNIPVYTKSYRYPFSLKEEVQNQIDKMLNQGIIQHSNSPWSSPIWIVPKKLDASGNKKWRLVVDYRKLNEKTIDDRYPVPNITDILDKLGRCQYFSTIDLASGFHQIEMSPEDVEKTAFSVDGGHYEFVRMPFGLKDAPATFQRYMDNTLREHIGKTCLVYMDDIIVFSTSLQEHLVNLDKIFNTLRFYNLKVQVDKCEFLQKEVAFLGHVVTPERVKPNPQKIDVIKNWPLPKNEKELKGFLGVVGYYRKFIQDFARIAKPLTQQLRKGETIHHSSEFISAFEKCKQILTSSHVLQYPDFTKDFILTTDASNYALGAVLSQGPVGNDKPIAFASRTLSKTEENYSTIEKELLAIDWACKYFRPYLYGRKFKLYTDHKPLTYALNLKTSNDRIVRMRLRISQYQCDPKYRPGKQNVVADGLSRIPKADQINNNNITEMNTNENTPSSDSETDEEGFIKNTETPLNRFKNQIYIIKDEINNFFSEQVFPGYTRKTITLASFDQSTAIKILKKYTHPTKVNSILCPEEWTNTLQTVYKNFFSSNDKLKILLTQTLLQDVQTEEDQNIIIKQTHERAHRGIEENFQEINRKYFFPRMKSKVRVFVNLCNICLENKYERKPYQMKFAYTPVPRQPLDILHVDIFISAPNFFLSAVDKLSRFAILIPVKSRSIPDIKRAVVTLLTTYGTPKMIVCDNELALKSVEIRGLFQRLNIEIYNTPSDHSEVNGIVERFHSTLSEIFRCIRGKYPDLCEKEIYKIATTLYNTTTHSVTNLKPTELFFGIKEGEERPLNLQIILENRNKIFDEIVLKLESKQKKAIDYHNRRRSDNPNFEVNEPIFVKTMGIPNKKRRKFRRQTTLSNRNKTVIDNRNIKIHKSNIKRKRKLGPR